MSRLAGLLIGLCVAVGVPSTSAQGIDNDTFASWRDSDQQVLAQLLRDMPKGGELHSHLSGAIHFDDLIRIAQQRAYLAAFEKDGTARGFVLPFAAGNPPSRTTDIQEGCIRGRLVCVAVQDLDAAQLGALRAAVTIDGDDASRTERDGFASFQDIFGALSNLTDNADVVPDLVRQAMQDAADHHVDYLELKLTPYGRLNSRIESVKIETFLDSIARAIRDQNAAFASAGRDTVTVRLIAQVDRRDPQRPGGATDLAPIACDSTCHLRPRGAYLYSQLRQAYYLASASRYSDLVVGFDFVSLPEQDLSTKPALGYLLGSLRAEFGRANMTVHAGESRRPGWHDHVGQALALGADRIGHAVNLEDDLAAWETVCRMGVPIEVNLTSNVLLGVVGRLEEHPFPRYFNRRSCAVTKTDRDRPTTDPVVLSTDDGGVFQTDMSNEFCLAATTFGLSWDEVKQLARNSLAHSFLPAPERRALLQSWEAKISRFEQTWQPKAAAEGCRVPQVE